MSLVYSRDGAAAGLLILQGLLQDIREDRFRPDETRSGRIVENAVVNLEDDAPVKPEPNHVDAEVIESSSSDESSSSGSSCDSGGHDFRRMPKFLKPPSAPEGSVMWQHGKSKILHLMETGNRRVFVCSRVAGKFHIFENLSVRYDTPICSLCFKQSRE